MTADRDFDRELGQWLDEVSTASVPDGLLNRSLARVGATHQRPGWLVRDRGRSPRALGRPATARARALGRPATARARTGRLLAFAVAVVVVAAGTGLFLRLSRSTSVGPSSAPSFVPAPSASVGPSSPTPSPSPNGVARAPSWAATRSMGTPRQGHTATLLPDGKVLVAGGYNGSQPQASAELYDPASGSWTATGSLLAARGGHRATLLPDGKVLVAGCANGIDAPSAELYDPGTGSWTATGNMVTPRCLDFTATLLRDGRVLVAGGMGTGNGHILASAELYDPGTGSWTATGNMGTPRWDHAATLLPDGRVLVTGGADHGGAACCYLASAELYDPGSGTWSYAATMGAQHGNHTATLLPNGRVLVAGSAELYDPGTDSWTATRNPLTIFAATASLLADGRVIVTDGSSVDVYDPGTGSWTAPGGKGTPRYRNGFTATLLPDGTVIVAGGFSDQQCGDCSTLASAELYDPGNP